MSEPADLAPNDRRLFHIATPEDAATLAADDVLHPPSLASEGFVHLSTARQVVGSTERHFPPEADLVLLELDPDRLADEVRWAEVYPGEHFPHLHGPLRQDAVRTVHPWSEADRRAWRF